MAKYHKQYIMVRCGDKATAQKVKSSTPPSLIFFNPDGAEYHRAYLDGKNAVESIKQAFQQAQEKYASRKISWATGSVDEVVAAAQSQRKIVALVRLPSDEKGEPTAKSAEFLATLEDRWLAKLQDELVFVQAPADENDAVCMTWGLKGGPSLTLIDPLQTDETKRVVERIAAPKTVAQIRAALKNELKKFEKSLKGK